MLFPSWMGLQLCLPHTCAVTAIPSFKRPKKPPLQASGTPQFLAISLPCCPDPLRGSPGSCFRIHKHWSGNWSEGTELLFFWLKENLLTTPWQKPKLSICVRTRVSEAEGSRQSLCMALFSGQVLLSVPCLWHSSQNTMGRAAQWHQQHKKSQDSPHFSSAKWVITV